MTLRTDHKGKQPSKALRKQVRMAFNTDKLKDICTRDDFSQYAEYVPLPADRWNSDRFYWYRDNGTRVLAVAHLDTVQRDRRCVVTDTASGLLACSGALDDRLGAYVILELLPALGVTCDILLTTDEESGASTASDFTAGKQYDHVIQFDRGGTDVVMYQYETDALATLVEACGARMGVGSYSDIAELEHLGAAAFNWGVGYEDYHSARSHAWLDDTFRMVARYVKFHRQNAGVHLAHVARWERDADGVPLPGASGWDDEWIMADCAHYVDPLDEDTYYEVDGYLECSNCANEAMAFNDWKAAK